MNVKVDFNNYYKILELYILPGGGLPIIKRDWISVFNILQNNKSKKLNKIEFYERSIFEKIL